MNKSGFVIVNDGSKFGLRNNEGQQVIPCIYDKILDYDDDGYIRVLIGDVYGTIDLDCKEVISHAAGLTHLGVFYGGTARARKKGKWGLVDEKGNDVTEFNYQDIKAHYKNGYSVIDATGKYGWLTEKGEFTPSKKFPKIKPKYKRIATFRYGIAPALTYDGKWIFIDKNQNRVGNYEYYSMDSVLRHGLYSVISKDHMYNLCKFDGKLLLLEWYDYISKFDNGYAIFCKGIRDNDDNLKKDISGQPIYMYGIIDLEGNYVMAPNYTEISWANDKKEYWYAEKWDAKYYLYPDGRRFLILPDGLHEVSKDTNYNPGLTKQKFNTINPVINIEFDISKFMQQLFCWIRGNEYDIKFYYRDTNLKFNVEKFYKPGVIIRAGQYLEMTDKLKCPIHNTRFIIASNHVPKVSDFKKNTFTVELPFKDRFLHFNSCFMVMNCIKYGGINQVLLLHLPYSAVALIEKKNVSKVIFEDLREALVKLIKKAEEDIQSKRGELVHGYSLSSDWQKRMATPIGINCSNEPISLKSEYKLTDSERQISLYCEELSGEHSYEWIESNFSKEF